MGDELTNEPTTNETDSATAGVPAEEPRQASGEAPGTGETAQERPPQERSQRPSGRGGSAVEPEAGVLDEVVVKIYRCAKVVKGGRRFSFGALVVVGNRAGRVGVGYGKAKEVPAAVEKARKAAQRAMVDIKLDGTTIPHPVKSKYRASQVLLLPARKGTGVIAGASVRAVMELAGVKDVYTKAHGSTGPKNLVKAAFQGLTSLRTRDELARIRGVSLS